MSEAGNSQGDEAQKPANEQTAGGGDATAGAEGATTGRKPKKAAGTPKPEDPSATPKPDDPAAAGSGTDKRVRGRVTRPSEETIGKLAQDLLEHPMVTGALSAVFETRERAARAQEVAMSALNLPSASDIERLTRRLRSVSQRLEGLEDGIDHVADRLEKLGSLAELHARLDAIEATLGRIEASLGTQGSQSD